MDRHALGKIFKARTPAQSLRLVARIGYTARGFVFLIVGVFALLAAFGERSRPRGISDALRALFEHPFGGVLLWIVALGLACFAAWRFLQGVFDADRHGDSAYGLARRALLVCNGVFYLALAAASVDTTLTVRRIGEDQSARDWTTWLLTKPLGRAAVGLLAAGFVATAIGLVVKVFREPYRRRLDTRKLRIAWAALLGSFGFLTRAAVFLMIGAFLAFAAYDADAREAVGVSGALVTLQRQPYGGVLLGAAGFGFLAFAGFEFLEAWARRIGRPHIPHI